TQTSPRCAIRTANPLYITLTKPYGPPDTPARLSHMTKVTKPVLLTLTVLLTVLTVIGAFLYGYEPETIFGHPTASLDNVLLIAPWVCALLAACCAFMGNEASDSTPIDPAASRFFQNLYLHGDRSDTKVLRALPHALITFPIASLIGAWGIGRIMNPTAPDVFDGWSRLILAVLAVVVTGMLQTRQGRRRHQLRALSADRLNTIGVVRQPRPSYASETPITRLQVEFPHASGTLRS